MKKKCSLFLKKAFTLLELLVVTFVILILIGYFVANSSSGIEKAKIARQQFQLAKIAEAIRLFEQDWGELPPDLSLLINPVGLTQYAETKGVNIAPKAYLDAPKNHCIRLTWLCSQHRTDYSDLTLFKGIHSNCEKTSCGTKTEHYVYDLSDADVKTLLNIPNVTLDRTQTYHPYTYALLDIWGTPVYYRPFPPTSKNYGKFALFSAGPDKKAAITTYSTTEWKVGSITFSNSEIKDPNKYDTLANPKEILILLDQADVTMEMDTQNNYNKDNIIYSPLE